MLIVGCDYHPRWQQVAWLDTETGESGEQKLVNGDGEAERWYRQLPPPSLIGLEATGNSRSEEHTSELQSLRHLVCRLLLEKKKTNNYSAGLPKATPNYSVLTRSLLPS